MKKLIFILLKIAELSLIPISYFLFNYLYFFEDKVIKYFFFKNLEPIKSVDFSFKNFILGLSITSIIVLIVSFFVFAFPSLFSNWILQNKEWSENISKWIKSRFS